jgi:hypothetical protein
MIGQIDLAGSFTLPGTSMTVNRMGYGAMQFAGRDGNKLVWGPPRDVEGAIAVLREAVARGVNHIDGAVQRCRFCEVAANHFCSIHCWSLLWMARHQAQRISFSRQ